MTQLFLLRFRKAKVLCIILTLAPRNFKSCTRRYYEINYTSIANKKAARNSSGF